MPLIRSGSAKLSRVDEALAIAQQLIDADQRALGSSAAGAEVSCRPQCTACCTQAVPVGPAELRAVVAAVKLLPKLDQERIATRIAASAEQLRAKGFTSDSLNRCASDAHATEVAEKYFSLKAMCPLLDDGVCSVRDARPLACREYLVTSDPRACAEMGENTVVRIRSKRDVLGGYAEFERDIGDRNSYILALALSAPTPASPAIDVDAATVVDRLGRPNR